jgi:aminoglycoside phosphotransferase (APT) family kinase protein
MSADSSMFAALNRDDIGEEDTRYPSEIWRRVLRHLGDHTAYVVRQLNLRPLELRLFEETPSYLAVRVSTAQEHLIFRFAPEGNFSAEVYYNRAMQKLFIPAPHVIHYDASASVVPCPYLVESYIGGRKADQIEEEERLWAGARQLGRTLRRIHRTPSPGFGYPLGPDSWSHQNWRSALSTLFNTSGASIYAPLLLSEEQWACFKAATLDSPLLDIDQARLIHGAIKPGSLVCTPGELVQFQALLHPGPLVGGDPLYDLACGLLPSHPEAFRTGLLEGYAALNPLSDEEEARLDRLALFVRFTEACRYYAYGLDHTILLESVLASLERYPLADEQAEIEQDDQTQAA